MARREFLRQGLTGVAGAALSPAALAGQQRPKTPRVVVWDERQPDQKQAYPNFLGNAVADHLRAVGGKAWEVASVGLDDPEQGLPDSVLNAADVLVWWGHVRHGDVKDELARRIVDRVKEGKLSLLALHSGHWSKPFIACMDERSVADALASLPAAERGKARVQTLPGDRRLMDRNEPLTPWVKRETGENGVTILTVKLPSCAFPGVANEGKPSRIKTLVRNHPVTKGLPETWDIPHTEMYDDPFHVPKPDLVLFEETWEAGQSFRSGNIWKLGKGMVFYFRPGHETYDVFRQPLPLKVVENAVRWLAAHPKKV